MNLIHIVGRKNHGKTTLIVELVQELNRLGVAVGTIKHSKHIHELDTPGKDSHAHRRAGASPAAIITEHLIGFFLPRIADIDPYAALAPMFAGCALVLVEGHLDAAGTKIEVWRQSVGTPCLASTRRDILAVISEDGVEVGVPVWPRGDIAALAQQVLRIAGDPARAADR
jgi:molybdopterin-guanine dinucleotide biosynthesis protein B